MREMSRFVVLCLVLGGALHWGAGVLRTPQKPIVQLSEQVCARLQDPLNESIESVRLELAVLALAEQWEWPLESKVLALRAQQIARAANIDCAPNCSQMARQQAWYRQDLPSKLHLRNLVEKSVAVQIPQEPSVCIEDIQVVSGEVTSSSYLPLLDQFFVASPVDSVRVKYNFDSRQWNHFLANAQTGSSSVAIDSGLGQLWVRLDDISTRKTQSPCDSISRERQTVERILEMVQWRGRCE